MCPRFLPSALLLLLAPSLRAGSDASGKAPVPDLSSAAAPSRSHFRFSAGAGYRAMGGVEFETGSRSGREVLPFPRTALRGLRSQAGSATEYADRLYADGYVNQDGGTLADGSTWFWGYETTAQLSSAGTGSSLTFHGQSDSEERETRRVSDRDPGSWDTDPDGAVPVLGLDWSYDLTPRLSAGISLQYSFLGFDGAHSLSNFSARGTRVSQAVVLTDTYDLGTVIAPAAPWRGSLEGPGPLISNLPSSRVVSPGGVLDSERTSFFNRIQESLDVNLHTLSLGPTLSAKAGVADFTLGVGLSLNVADWSATHTETLYEQREDRSLKVLKRWAERSSGTDVLPGFYVQMAASVPLTRHLSLSGFGYYAWSRTLEARIGPSRFTVDPSGWTVGGSMDWSF